MQQYSPVAVRLSIERHHLCIAAAYKTLSPARVHCHVHLHLSFTIKYEGMWFIAENLINDKKKVRHKNPFLRHRRLMTGYRSVKMPFVIVI